MSSTANYTTVQSKGIYHGLPVFPDSLKGLSAIVTGANGISGDHMVRVLAESPERWSNVYALSRRPPAIERQSGKNVNVQHISLDFMNSTPEEIARALKENGVKADYVFFFSYIQVQPREGGGLWSNAEDMVQVNSTLLSNFLEALKHASITPKRFMLQTGAKHYGIHLGPTITPQHESDPRILLEPNFYYPQEDLVFEYCKETGAEWNVVRPSSILGAVREAAMNLVYPLGVFAAINAHLGRPLAYPGSIASLSAVQDVSSAMMNAYLEEWAVLSPAAANEAFNASDCSQFAMGKFWLALAKWYGVECEFPDENTTYKSYQTPYAPPPRGFGPRETIEYTYTLTDWASDPQVRTAWRELMQQHDLQSDPISNEEDRMRIFGFTDHSIRRPGSLAFNMDKSRSLGWHGTVDSVASIRKVLAEFVDLKMIPPIPN